MSIHKTLTGRKKFMQIATPIERKEAMLLQRGGQVDIMTRIVKSSNMRHNKNKLQYQKLMARS